MSIGIKRAWIEPVFVASIAMITASVAAFAQDQREEQPSIVNFFHPVWSPDGSKLAFDANLDGDQDIYVYDFADGQKTKLTHNQYADAHPYWSKDGKQLVFESNRDGNYEIYTMNADGASQRRITDSPTNEYTGSWSYDGTRIAYMSIGADGNVDVFVNVIETGRAMRVTSHEGMDGVPAFSPTRNEIVFESRRFGEPVLFISDINGKMRPLLPDAPYPQSLAWWTNDGDYIAFRSGAHRYHIVDRHGKNSKLLLDKAGVRGVPSLSPDGSKIALFLVNEVNGADIIVLNLNTGRIKNITKDLRPSRRD
ncbi:MAG: hypothetical protein AAFW68_03095 [Pseudomonadota bacterium]